MNSSNTKIINWLTASCFIMFMFFAFLSFYYDVSGIVRQIIWGLLFIINLRHVRFSNRIDYIVLFYFFMAFLSLTGNIVISYPTENFITVFIYSYIPIIFYFVGKNDKGDYPNFYLLSNFGAMILFIIGFYFLLFPTDIYMEKALEVLNQHNYYTEETMEYARFSSFIDSYHTSNIGVCTLCFGFGLLKYQTTCYKSKKIFILLSYIFIITSIVAVLLARQRVAIYIGILILSYYLLINNSRRFGSIFIIASLFLIAIYLVIRSSDAVYVGLISRLFSNEASSTLVSSRSGQWQNALNGFAMEPLFGLGIGSGGHVALSTNQDHPFVTDGSYFKILLEGGVASFIPFMIILLSSFIKSIKLRKKYYVEAPLLFFFACSLIGSNIIDMPYIIMFMWYIIGRINSNK